MYALSLISQKFYTIELTRFSMTRVCIAHFLGLIERVIAKAAYNTFKMSLETRTNPQCAIIAWQAYIHRGFNK